MTSSQRSQRSIAYFRGEWRVIGLSAILTSFAALSEAAALVLVVTLAEGLASGSQSLTPQFGFVALDLTFFQAVLISAGFLLFTALARISAGFVTIRRMTELAREWRRRLLEGFLGSTFDFATRAKKGEILETAGQQASQGAQAVDLLALTLDSVFTMLILAGVAFALDPVVASVLLFGGGLLLLILRPISKRVRILSGQVADQDVEFGNALDEIVRVNRDIRLFGAQAEYARVGDRIASRSAAIDRRRSLYSRSVPIAYQTMGSLLLLTALATSFEFAGASLAAMGGAALLLLRGISYGQRVSTFQQGLARTMPLVERVRSQLQTFDDQAARFGTAEIDQVESMEFDRVDYQYHPDGPPALSDVSLVLKEHGITGLVGPSGSGKSTLAQLVLRLRTATHGRILVNGEPIESFDPMSWNRAVSFVPQETELIHGTVIENVGFFRDEIGQAEIKAAVDAVGLAELVESLPNGFDTQIGPTVHNFSGGQKQRIGIARALVGQPTLFVLDEPTSALDEESEEWVMRTLSSLRESTFVVVITHRQTTLQHCDTVIHMRDGRVVSTTGQ